MNHLAIPVRDQAGSRRFYETCFGFGARPAKVYDDGVLMLYDASGFALALGPMAEPVDRPSWMHFGVGLPSREAVLALRDRLVDDGIRDPDRFRDRILARAVERANANRSESGLAPVPPITPHSLRRTWATFCAMVGRDPKWVASQIGHVNPKFTFSVYQQVATRRYITRRQSGR